MISYLLRLLCIALVGTDGEGLGFVDTAGSGRHDFAPRRLTNSSCTVPAPWFEGPFLGTLEYLSCIAWMCEDVAESFMGSNDATCEFLTGVGCDFDMNRVHESFLPGSKVKNFCPESCYNCERKTCVLASVPDYLQCLNSECEDTDPALLGGFLCGITAFMGMGITCETDMNSLDPAWPNGTLMNILCPKYCGLCSPKVDSTAIANADAILLAEELLYKTVSLKDLREEAPIPWNVSEVEALHRLLSAVRGSKSGIAGSSVEYFASTIASHTSSRRLSASLPHGTTPCDWPGIRCYVDNHSAPYAFISEHARLGGTLPSEIKGLTSCRIIIISHHDLEGTIPSEFGELSRLEVLSLNGNSLQGPIPDQVLSMDRLKSLGLSVNRLEGTLPDLHKMVSLESITLYTNQIEGSLPTEIGQYRGDFLYLDDNRLTGTLPTEIGLLTQLFRFHVSFNSLTGPIPTEVGLLSSLWELHLQSSQLQGTLPTEIGQCIRVQDLIVVDTLVDGPIPTEIGRMNDRLYLLDLSRNSLEGYIPTEIGELTNLEELQLSNNRFEGVFPDISSLSLLTVLLANGNQFTSAGGIGQSVARVDFAENQLTVLPQVWYSLAKVEYLNMSWNKLTSWPLSGVPPREWFDPEQIFETACLFDEPRFDWPFMRNLFLDENPLNVDARDFLSSLAHLRSLTILTCAACGLINDVPQEAGGLVPVFPNLLGKEGKCRLDMKQAFPSLVSLDLGQNNITGFTAPPPPLLFEMRLTSNSLTGLALNELWWTTDRLSRVQVQQNPNLRANVTEPLPKSGCPDFTYSNFELVANPFDFGFQPGMPEGALYECTSLCPGSLSLSVDFSLNLESLCRCRRGYQGSSTNCVACSENEYSTFTGPYLLNSVCEACPLGASTLGKTAQDLSGCECGIGKYKSAENKSDAEAQWHCESCPLFKTTAQPGSLYESDCRCKVVEHNVQEIAGVCACPEKYFMNMQTQFCEKCSSVGEDCDWAQDQAEASVKPPTISVGFWAKPVDNESTFAGHSIYKCYSGRTCLGSGQCASGRTGVACGDCLPRYHAASDGECEECEYAPSTYIVNMVIGAVAMTPFILLLQYFFVSAAKPAAKPGKIPQALQRLRVCVRQVVKYVQILGLFSAMNVKWPEELDFFYQLSGSLSAPYIAWGCVMEQQTTALLVSFKWLLPAVVAILALAGVPLSILVQFVMTRLPSERAQKLSRKARLSFRQSLFFIYQLFMVFFFSLTQNCLMVFVNRVNPNMKLTIVAFPALEYQSSEWWDIFPGALAASLVYIVLCASAAAYLVTRVAVSLTKSHGLQRGFYALAVEDFRVTNIHWPLWLIARDFALNVIAALFPGSGVTQIFLCAIGVSFYTFGVLRYLPYKTRTCNLLEVWTMISLFIILTLSAGLGFATASGTPDSSTLFEGGENSTTYKTRSNWLLIIQLIALGVPFVVIISQVLMFIPCFDKWITKNILPEPREVCSAFIREHTDNFLTLNTIIEFMDDIEWYLFEKSLRSAASTKFLVPRRRGSWEMPVVGLGVNYHKAQPRNSSHSNEAYCGAPHMEQTIFRHASTGLLLDDTGTSVGQRNTSGSEALRSTRTGSSSVSAWLRSKEASSEAREAIRQATLSPRVDDDLMLVDDEDVVVKPQRSLQESDANGSLQDQELSGLSAQRIEEEESSEVDYETFHVYVKDLIVTPASRGSIEDPYTVKPLQGETPPYTPPSRSTIEGRSTLEDLDSHVRLQSSKKEELEIGETPYTPPSRGTIEVLDSHMRLQGSKKENLEMGDSAYTPLSRCTIEDLDSHVRLQSNRREEIDMGERLSL